MRRLLKLIKVRDWQLAYMEIFAQWCHFTFKCSCSICDRDWLLTGNLKKKKRKKVKNMKHNALVSLEVSVTVFCCRLECVLFMSDLSLNSDSYVWFWVAKMKTSRSSASFPSSRSDFQNYQSKPKNWQYQSWIFLWVMFMVLFVWGRTIGYMQEMGCVFSWRIHWTVSCLLSYTE